MSNDWLHLKRFGYAPGDYLSKCRVCGKVADDVDKRATCCRPCAEKRFAAEAHSIPPSAPPAAPPMSREVRMAVMLAYGHLWHINNEPAAPIPMYAPEKAAYEARKQLRDLLTTQERREAIDQVGFLIGRHDMAPELAAQPPAAPPEPSMADAMAAGDGTLHGAISYWQQRALKAEAALDADETNRVLADNYIALTCGGPLDPLATNGPMLVNLNEGFEAPPHFVHCPPGAFSGFTLYRAVPMNMVEPPAAPEPSQPPLLQDCDRGLSKALASTPDARRHAREAAAAIAPPEPAGIDPLQDPKRPGYFMNYAEDETPAEMVLRKLACWLGAGGYNAPKVDAEVFHEKIIWGVNEAVRAAEQAALRRVAAPEPAEPPEAPPEPPTSTALQPGDVSCPRCGFHFAAPPTAAPQEPARPDILERLTYHALERDDLTLDEVLDVLAQGWKKVRGRTERQMLLQMLALMALEPAEPPAPERVALAQEAPEHTPNAKLMELADRIDHEQLWRRPALEHFDMTPEQRDRMDAGVNLRRYADLLGNSGWRLYPPRPGFSFRASSLEKVVEMARNDETRRLAAAQEGKQ